MILLQTTQVVTTNPTIMDAHIYAITGLVVAITALIGTVVGFFKNQKTGQQASMNTQAIQAQRENTVELSKRVDNVQNQVVTVATAVPPPNHFSNVASIEEAYVTKKKERESQ